MCRQGGGGGGLLARGLLGGWARGGGHLSHSRQLGQIFELQCQHVRATARWRHPREAHYHQGPGSLHDAAGVSAQLDYTKLADTNCEAHQQAGDGCRVLVIFRAQLDSAVEEYAAHVAREQIDEVVAINGIPPIRQHRSAARQNHLANRILDHAQICYYRIEYGSIHAVALGRLVRRGGYLDGRYHITPELVVGYVGRDIAAEEEAAYGRVYS